MKVDSLRRFLQPAAEVRHPLLVPTILVIVGLATLLVVAMVGGPKAYAALPVLLWTVAVTSFFAALASADIRFKWTLPSPRTAFFSLVSLVTLSLAVAVLGLTALEGPYMSGRYYARASLSTSHAQLLDKGSAGSLAYILAADMDVVVAQWAKDEEEIQASSIEGWFLARPWYRRAFAVETGAVRRIAESRLQLLSGAAPGWASTARLCEERSARIGGSRYKWNYNPGAASTARDYSLLLGREVKPVDLLPLVPNGRCE